MGEWAPVVADTPVVVDPAATSAGPTPPKSFLELFPVGRYKHTMRPVPQSSHEPSALRRYNLTRHPSGCSRVVVVVGVVDVVGLFVLVGDAREVEDDA